MLGASTACDSPIGYQTNRMVVRPGGYRFFDFARLGAPLSLVLAVPIAVLTYCMPAVWLP